ncbi:LysR family transcriptional regulator [Aliamphritea ceti]|uniref:LysR family transcriptional regulator n=1 Tax=Aliamphritea ceti TaxID=1524258 RepID=UPI0021C4A536|nr:LysR family transcriptional regulator [Aliamphritea ceti]
MDSILGMRTFIRVVDTGGFSSAARQAGIAPSSVSRQINELEKALGVQLFQRTTRKLSLTEAGYVYYERACRILTDIDETLLAVSQTEDPSGVLKITMPTGIGKALIISALPKFMKQYPDIKIVMSMSDQLTNIVEQGVDVAIRIGQLNDSSLKARKIGESRRIVCASPEYLEREGMPKHPKDLEKHNCLTFRNYPGQSVWEFRKANNIQEVKVSGNFFAHNADALIAAAISGLGLILLPSWNVELELHQQHLRQVLPEYKTEPHFSPVWALHSHQRKTPPKISVFIDFLIAHLSENKIPF